MKNVILILTILLMSSIGLAHEKHGYSKKSVSATQGGVAVEIGKKGFKPERALTFAPGENIVLNVKRTTKKTCMTSLKHPKNGKLVNLPMNKVVRFEIGTYDKPQEVKLLCGMGMKAGVVSISESKKS